MNATEERRRITQTEALTEAAEEAGLPLLAEAIVDMEIEAIHRLTDAAVDAAAGHIANGREAEARQALGI